MLIFPIENKPDWRRPPLLSIGLILVNLLVFVFYQSQDEARSWQAIERYTADGLVAREVPLYRAYLQQTDPELERELEPAFNDSRQHADLAGTLLFDREFDGFLRKQWAQSEEAEQPLWQSQREQAEKLRDQVSGFRFGLTPAAPEPVQFLSSQFLHGDWNHLIGNMVFLFLFGFTLELVLGALPCLLLYLLCGVAACALHLLIHSDSMAPLIGASGAISGLMGMYLAIYQLRKIRFFYTLGFYFGEFTAPALVVLPVWLGKELYGYLYLDTDVAYWAHIGGLLTGVGLALPFRKRLLNNCESTLEKSDPDAEIKPQLDKIKSLVNTLNIPSARVYAKQLAQRFPHNATAWRTFFDVAKHQPNSAEFHQTAFDLFKQSREIPPTDSEWNLLVHYALAEYRNAAASPKALNAAACTLLAQRFWHSGDLALAIEMAEAALKQGGRHLALAELLKKIIRYYQQRQDLDSARRYAANLKALSGVNTAG